MWHSVLSDEQAQFLRQEREALAEDFAVQSYPLPLLKELNIVDTPGTNAVIRCHGRLTDEFVPRSDLVLFTTSADRPMTEGSDPKQ